MRSNNNKSNAAYQILANSKENLSLAIHHVDTINDNSARIVMSHYKFKENYSRKQYADAFSVLCSQEASLIPETLETIEHSKSPHKLISGIIVANNRNLEYDKAINELNLKVITANVFMDDENNIWEVKGEGDNKRLVQKNCEDFGSLIANRLSRLSNVAVASVANSYSNITAVKKSDVVMAYNSEASTFEFGVVIAHNEEQIIAVNPSNSKSYVINPLSVVIASDTDLNQESLMVQALSEPNMKLRAKLVLDYLKQIYRDKMFMQQYAKIMTAAVTEVTKPLV